MEGHGELGIIAKIGSVAESDRRNRCIMSMKGLHSGSVSSAQIFRDVPLSIARRKHARLHVSDSACHICTYCCTVSSTKFKSSTCRALSKDTHSARTDMISCIGLSITNRWCTPRTRVVRAPHSRSHCKEHVFILSNRVQTEIDGEDIFSVDIHLDWHVCLSSVYSLSS